MKKKIKYKKVVKWNWGLFSSLSIPIFLMMFAIMASTGKLEKIQELELFGYVGLVFIALMLLITYIAANKHYEERQ